MIDWVQMPWTLVWQKPACSLCESVLYKLNGKNVLSVHIIHVCLCIEARVCRVMLAGSNVALCVFSPNSNAYQIRSSVLKRPLGMDWFVFRLNFLVLEFLSHFRHHFFVSSLRNFSNEQYYLFFILIIVCLAIDSNFQDKTFGVSSYPMRNSAFNLCISAWCCSN